MGLPSRLIGQQIGLPSLIPLALELLSGDPFTEGGCYKGDLLAAVLRADSSFWIASPELRAEARIAALGGRAFCAPPSLSAGDEHGRWPNRNPGGQTQFDRLPVGAYAHYPNLEGKTMMMICKILLMAMTMMGGLSVRGCHTVRPPAPTGLPPPPPVPVP